MLGVCVCVVGKILEELARSLFDFQVRFRLAKLRCAGRLYYHGATARSRF